MLFDNNYRYPNQLEFQNKQQEDPEGWDGEGGGRGDRDGEHM